MRRRICCYAILIIVGSKLLALLVPGVMEWCWCMFLLKCVFQFIICGSIFLATFFYFKPHLIIPAMVKIGVLLSPLTKRRTDLRDGLWCSYLEFGSVESCPETLLFIHGYSGSAVDFLQHLRHLGKSKHMVFMNMINHGDSVAVERDVTMAEMVDYVDQFVHFSGLELRKFHIVGFSMGGGLAIQYASMRPERVASLFLINPYGLYDQEKNPNFSKDTNMRYETNADFMNMFEKMSNGTMSLPWWIISPLRHHKNNTASREMCVMRGQMKTSSLMEKSYLEGLSGTAVMYVQGDEDIVTPKEGLDYFLSHVPTASYAIIEGGSHFILYTHVERICLMINEWIKKVEHSSGFE